MPNFATLADPAKRPAELADMAFRILNAFIIKPVRLGLPARSPAINVAKSTRRGKDYY